MVMQSTVHVVTDTLFELPVVPRREDRRHGSRNAAKSARVTTVPPWASWTCSRVGRHIKFIETYCIVPKGFGAGQPMRLGAFQKDAIEQLLAEGIRTGEFSLARGNGKSSFMSAFGLAHTFTEDWSPQVPLIAVTLKQIVKATYNTSVHMVKLCDELRDRSVLYTAAGDQRITVPYNSGEMFPIAADVDALQGLDPSLALVDEVGFIAPAAWHALTLAGGKRPESLIVGLGTTGKRTSALYALEQQFLAADPMPAHCRINYSADPGCDLADRGQWRKANPAIDEGFLSEDAIAASLDITPEAEFRAFRLNQWVDLPHTQSWLGPHGYEMWAALADPDYTWDRTLPSFVGVDVSIRWDTTAVCAVQRRHDSDRWHARAWIFRATDGRTVDQAPVRSVILNDIGTVAACAYDPKYFEASAQDLAETGLLMIEVPQTQQRMVPAIGGLYRWITNGQLTHDGAPDFASQVVNAVRRETDAGFTLSKLRSELKIDAAIALSLAVSIADPNPYQPSDDAYKIW